MKIVKSNMWVWAAGLAFTMVVSSVGFEAEQRWRISAPSAHAQARNTEPSKALPRYVPPQFSSPTGRMGGGTRGLKTNTLKVSALAPDHIGLTGNDQPSLYWFLSQSTPLPVELTISASRAIEPLLETRLRPPLSSGIQRIKLSDYNVRLAPGVVYRWYVSVINDLEQRSRDVVTSGVIRRQETPQALRVRLAQADKSRTPHLYAEAGFWYDAVLAISELIDAAPRNMDLRQQRAALMEQVGLREAAAFDRQR
ncbi:MAG: hypothetical protein ETSY1_08745 [Candidatus Entotheonella factor]|uniref:DUF928 domain-containing protein n=1 Tax=Entotheonella factor TaxID=1429438 RepID=W4LT83_ENTF1|nr:MAG: hypothetical protein ETSY1_08745 [Candidatus Entotheonella factor]